jgi:hypothetical protein
MTTPFKHYKLIAISGRCAILAQILGTDEIGEEVPTFFATCMLTKDGKLATSFDETECMMRISKNAKFDDSLIGFCHGYSAAAQERRGGMMPQDWTHKQCILAENVEKLHWGSSELKRLKAYPQRPEEANEPFELRPVSRN